MEEELPQMVRVIPRHTVNGSGVSIPEQRGIPNQHMSSRAYHDSHLTKDVCRYTVGYVLQLNPVTVPQLSTNPSRGMQQRTCRQGSTRRLTRPEPERYVGRCLQIGRHRLWTCGRESPVRKPESKALFLVALRKYSRIRVRH